MTLLTQINKIGITGSQLDSLTNQEIIRIEKKLKAELRMNDSLDVNDVDQILNALKNNKRELQILFQPQYLEFRNIIASEKEFFVFRKEQIGTLSQDETFVAFIHAHFSNELAQYVDKCLKEEHYNALYSFLYYNSLYSSDLLDSIAQKLNQKLVYILEVVKMEANDLTEKVEAALNPFFYRCLNALGGLQFESEIIQLINATIEHIKDKKVYFRLLFSMGSFNAAKLSTKDVIEKNHGIAISVGASEITYPTSGKEGKGGARITAVKQRKKTSSSSGLSIVGGAGFILFIIIRILLAVGRNSSSHSVNYSTDDYGLISFEELMKQQEEKMRLEGESDVFLETMNYLHSNMTEIISQKDISFKAEAVVLANPSFELEPDKNEDGSPNALKLKNQTDQNLILYASRNDHDNGNYYFARPNQIFTIPQLTDRIRIYTGEDLQMVEYISEEEDTLTHFRFNSVTEDNLNSLQNNYCYVPSKSFMEKRQISVVKDSIKYSIEVETIKE